MAQSTRSEQQRHHSHAHARAHERLAHSHRQRFRSQPYFIVSQSRSRSASTRKRRRQTKHKMQGITIAIASTTKKARNEEDVEKWIEASDVNCIRLHVALAAHWDTNGNEQWNLLVHLVAQSKNLKWNSYAAPGLAWHFTISPISFKYKVNV